MNAKILEFKGKPVLYTCSSAAEIGPLVEASKKVSKGPDFVLLLDNSGRAVSRVLPAYVNAAIRFNEGIARASTMQLEMLLLVCGTMNIGKALKECGAKNKGSFLVFATKNALLERFVKGNKVKIVKKIPFKLDPKTAGNVAITELLNE